MREKLKRIVAAILIFTLVITVPGTYPVLAEEAEEASAPVAESSIEPDEEPEPVAESYIEPEEEPEPVMESYIAPEEGPEPLAESSIASESDTSGIDLIIAGKSLMFITYLADTSYLYSQPSTESEPVCEIPCGTTLYPVSAHYSDGDYWFMVSADADDSNLVGFVPRESFICVDEDYLDWEQSLATIPADISGEADGPEPVGSAGGSDAVAPVSVTPVSERAAASIYSFPDSYRKSLKSLLDKHPQWVFVPQKTDMTLDEAISSEISDKNRNWVSSSAKDSYKDGQAASGWYYASRACLKYYMNPANFVGSEQDIFMFEQLTYNSSYHTFDGVRSVLSGTFMSGDIPGEGMTYAQAFYEIGQTLKVSPYHLASRVIQEQGKGTSPLISGTYEGYTGYYNYFNVGASGKTNTEVYTNGLTYARDKGWDSRYKSLQGGSEFDSKNYILKGQDTLYLEKYNVVKKVYTHQYMQNVAAPKSEASNVYRMYQNSGALDNAFVFKIPVYDGETISPEPEPEPDPVPETAPIPEMSAATVNVWQTAGTPILILEQGGNPVKDVTLLYKNAPSEDFVMTPVGSSWELQPTDACRSSLQSSGKKLTRNLTMRVFTDNGAYNFKFSATATSAKPAITFKQVKKPNLFFSEDTDEALAGFVPVTSETVIGVSANEAFEAKRAASGKPYYAMNGFDDESGIILVRPRELNASNASGIYKKISLDVTLEGYYPITCKLTVASVNAKPSITAAGCIIYGESGESGIRLSGSEFPADMGVECTDPYIHAEWDETGRSIHIRADEGFRTGKKKFRLTSSKWNAPVVLTVSVKRSRVPAVKLSKTKIRLNSALNVYENGYQVLKTYVNGSDLTISDLSVRGVSSAAVKLTEADYLRVQVNDGSIGLGLDPDMRGTIKAGTYKYEVTGTAVDYDGTEYELRPAQLSVVVVDKAPASLITLTPRGSINTVNRADSFISYTPKITDLGATRVTDVAISGENIDLFSVRLYNMGERLPDKTTVSSKAGAIVLYAEDDAPLNIRTKYSVRLNITLDNGLKVTKTVTVKPIQSVGKTAFTVSNLLLPADSTGRSITIRSRGTTVRGSLIDRVELVEDANSSNFVYTPDEDSAGVRMYKGYLKPRSAEVKPGKYKLKFRLYYRGKAVNADPAILSISVRVI